MKKLKKLARTWGVIALAMLFFIYVGKYSSQAFYVTFLAFFVVSGIFILFGWDKHITYGDPQNYAQTTPSKDDDDEWVD